MSSPQLENGFVRIANEIIDEVTRRDFSKRQINILLFLWRLSYGCNKSVATIPRMADFSLCGVGRQNVKKELEHLETCKVISWDRSTSEFTFNKNHKEWIVTPIKGWNESDLNKLVHLNIKEKFSKQEQKEVEKGSQNKNSDKDGIDESSQNKNSEQNKVLKLRTWKFSKQEHPKGLKLRRSKRGWMPKDIIKDIKDKDIKDINNSNPFTFFENNISPLSPYAITQLTDWSELLPDDVLIFSMELAVEANKRSLGYINTVLTNWKNEGVKNLADAKRSNQEFKNRFANNNRFDQPRKAEVIPEWFDKREQSESTAKPTEDADEAELAALLQKHAGG